ncbi:hypothetical protein THAOC_00093, partial [Thalassiosira oceanica]
MSHNTISLSDYDCGVVDWTADSSEHIDSLRYHEASKQTEPLTSEQSSKQVGVRYFTASVNTASEFRHSCGKLLVWSSRSVLSSAKVDVIPLTCPLSHSILSVNVDPQARTSGPRTLTYAQPSHPSGSAPSVLLEPPLHEDMSFCDSSDSDSTLALQQALPLQQAFWDGCQAARENMEQEEKNNQSLLGGAPNYQSVASSTCHYVEQGTERPVAATSCSFAVKLSQCMTAKPVISSPVKGKLQGTGKRSDQPFYDGEYTNQSNHRCERYKPVPDISAKVKREDLEKLLSINFEGDTLVSVNWNTSTKGRNYK